MKCQKHNCNKDAKVVFTSKRGVMVGYCNDCYGDGKWIESQKLFNKSIWKKTNMRFFKFCDNYFDILSEDGKDNIRQTIRDELVINNE